jgi:hypothetical protein
MTMTKLAAKRAALAMWRWLRDNPGKGKEDYDIDIYDKYEAGCPMCELFVNQRSSCMSCPLNGSYTGFLCIRHHQPYSDWKNRKSSKNAQRVIDQIEAWKI